MCCVCAQLRLEAFLSYDEAMQIRVLPRNIALLVHVQTLNLYGSNLVELPAEVGDMRSLKTLVVHTSYWYATAQSWRWWCAHLWCAQSSLFAV